MVARSRHEHSRTPPRVPVHGAKMHRRVPEAARHAASAAGTTTSVSNVFAALECGIGVEGVKKFLEGDVIEVYEIKEVKRKLELN